MLSVVEHAHPAPARRGQQPRNLAGTVLLGTTVAALLLTLVVAGLGVLQVVHLVVGVRAWLASAQAGRLDVH